MPANHGVIRAEVQVLSGERDPRSATDPKRPHDIGLAIARRITQQSHTPLPTPDCDKQVAVLQYHEVPRRTDRLSHDQRAESRLELQTGVVRRADGLG